MSVRARLLASVLALLLVGGCQASGTIAVNADDTVDADVAVVLPIAERPGRNCPRIEGLSVEQAVADVEVRCRYTGRLTPEARRLSSIFGFRHIGNRLLVQNPSFHQFRGASRVAALEKVSALDITVTFPGPVEAHAGGVPDGTTLRLTDPAELAQPGGVWVLAADSPEVPFERFAFPAGLLSGALAGVLVAAVAFRRSADAAKQSPPADV